MIQSVSDRTARLALLGSLPPLFYLSQISANEKKKPTLRQLPGFVFDTKEVVPEKLSSYKHVSYEEEEESTRIRSNLSFEEPNALKKEGKRMSKSLSNFAIHENPSTDLTWAETQRVRATYQKAEIGQSPRRSRRSTEKKHLKIRVRSAPEWSKSRSTPVVKGLTPRLRPTNARRSAERKLIRNSKARRVFRTRWQEKRLPLLRQAYQQRENLLSGLIPSPRAQATYEPREVQPLTLQAKPTVFEPQKQSLEWRGLPYHTLSLVPEPGRSLSKKSPSVVERFYGPVQGPRLRGGGVHTARIRFFLGVPEARYQRQDAVRLYSATEKRDRARYAVRNERQQDLAEERRGEAGYSSRRYRRYRRGRKVMDRPYRAIRLGQLQLGRRPHPFLAARTRPFRRRDWLSQTLQRETIASKTKKRRSGKGTRRLPALQIHRRTTNHWSRYLFGNDLSLAQERRKWWRAWHRLDPNLYGELRRAGSRFRDRTGRRNLGWWRSLVGTQLDSSFSRVRMGRAKAAFPLVRRSFYRSRVEAKVPIWRERRTVPRGWASRLTDPGSLQRVLARDLKGRPDPSLPFWSLRPASTPQDLRRAPFTILWLYGAWQIRSKAYESVQGDFLRARETILHRGGVREIDPEWRNWLLDALGISRANAGIRSYPPGNRSLSRHLAGLRRDLPALTERLWYLRSARRGRTPTGRGPRPTLLVGAPGTGKTSLVRVLADEAGVPVVYQCLAAFTDAGAKFTAFGFGRTVAPQAVQRGFAEAREASPAILFLDEVDSLGANRGGVLDSPQESALRTGDQVLGLGQLLVEIDHADKNKGLVLFAATNRPQNLDPALVRPGRFDRTLSVPLPNRAKRRAILKLYSGRFATVPNLDWDYLAARTRGVSAAHLAALTNRAALSTFLKGQPFSFEQGFEVALKRRRQEKDSRVQKGDPYSQLRKAYAAASQAIFGSTIGNPLDWVSSEAVHMAYPRATYQRQKDRWREVRFYLLGYAAELLLLKTTNQTPSYWFSTLQSTHLRQATRRARQLASMTAFSPSMLSLQTQEFEQETMLLQYALERMGEQDASHLRTSMSALQETLEWPSEWYAFEIAEVAGFRSVGWVPPELHVNAQSGPREAPRWRQYRFLALQENLQLLETKRVQLDLISSELRKSSTLSKQKLNELLS